MSGILQRFDIASDKDEMLEIALQLLFFWRNQGILAYKKVYKPYPAYKQCDEGAALMGLEFWSYKPSSRSNASEYIELPFTLSTPKKLFQFMRGWLDEAEYGPGTGTDGSEYKGWRVTTNDADCFSVVTLWPEWIVYGK